MKRFVGYKYELKPNNKQVGLFNKYAGAARFAWNWGLARRKEMYLNKDSKKRVTTAINQYKELVKLKATEFPWLYDVARAVPQESLRLLEKAHSRFFRCLREGKKSGKVGFKKKYIHDSFILRECIHVYPKSVKLPRIGIVRIKEDTSRISGRILSATITRKIDRWFISFLTEQNVDECMPVNGDIVGIDLGITNFVTIYNGKECNSIKTPLLSGTGGMWGKNMNKIKRLSKVVSRRKRESHNKTKAVSKVSKIYYKLYNVRKDFLAKLSTQLAKTKSVIIIEDLNVQGLVQNRHLAGSIANMGWSIFVNMLEYKTQWYGSKLIKIGRFEPSSKACNVCGMINSELVLSNRVWICQECGTTHDRDENAAKNIRDAGLKILSTDGLAGINACGVTVSPHLKKASDSEARSECLIDKDKTHRTEFW